MSAFGRSLPVMATKRDSQIQWKKAGEVGCIWFKKHRQQLAGRCAEMIAIVPSA
jgi:hypothetical protein